MSINQLKIELLELNEEMEILREVQRKAKQEVETVKVSIHNRHS